MSVMVRRLAITALAAGLASCARGATTTDRNAAPIPVATMSAHGSARVSLDAPAVRVDFDKATCTLASPYDDHSGLRVTATSSQSAVDSVVIVGSSVVGVGDLTWSPDGTRARFTAPAQVDVSLPDGVVFAGGVGSTTTLHVEGGGRRGTATFQHATFVSHKNVTDAAGTISWTCS